MHGSSFDSDFYTGPALLRTEEGGQVEEWHLSFTIFGTSSLQATVPHSH